MTDYAHKETDKKIKTVRNRLADEYKQAEKELKKKTDQYFAKFKEMDEQKRKLVQDGGLSQSEYIEWRRNKMLYGEAMRQNTARMAEYLANVDQRAADIVNGQLAGVYATNYNFASYQIEERTAGASFTLHDERTVARLAKDNPRLLPKVDPDKVKGQAWSRRKINNVITQGILQGEAIPDIAKELSKVVGMEWNSAVRNARTAITAAENAGRLGSYYDAQDMGIKMKKQWMATLDERTRQSHAEIDGEIVDVDEAFSNGLMYPGDPDGGDPAEIYNCRCTMVADLEGAPKAEPEQTFEEWQKEKEKNAEKISETKQHQQETRVSLRTAYENHRITNGLTSVPEKQLADEFFESNYGRIDSKLSKAISNEIKTLVEEYDTTLCKVRLMDKSEYVSHINSFAFTRHDYSTDISTLVLNPTKFANYDKMVSRIAEISKGGYAARIAEENYGRYVATHEFAHTLLDMQTPLSNARNWVGIDYKKIKSARKEIDAIYNSYISEISSLESKKNSLETDFIMGDAKAGEEARKLTKEINKIKISRYSMENSDEFMAEAFTQAKLGDPDQKYVKQVMDIVNKYFERKK